MSNTPHNADACTQLLDNGWAIQLYKNVMGSYTAIGHLQHTSLRVITDDFTPSQALFRLTEKALNTGEYSDG